MDSAQNLTSQLAALRQLYLLLAQREKIMLQQIADLQTAVGNLSTQVSAAVAQLGKPATLSAEDQAALTQAVATINSSAAALQQAIPAAPPSA
jgi:hypothetical protein